MSLTRNTRTVIRRLAWVFEELQANRPVSIASIMERWEVSRATARRDIDTLRRDFGLEIKWKRGKGTYQLSAGSSNFLTAARKIR
jgi:predicted DNA-binding transcriptional regulator YafY